MEPGVIAAGFVIGVLIGLTGMGGGSLTTPFLILFAGVGPMVAVGTDLVYSAATKWLGAAIHLRQRTVDLRLAGLVAAGSVPGSLAGVAMIHSLGDSADDFVAKGLGVALILVAAVQLLRSRWADRPPPPDPPRRRSPVIAVILGAGVGVLVGLTSVGSGTLVVAGLLLLYPSLPIARIVGTDLVQAAFLTSAAGVAYLVLGRVELGLVGALLVGSMPGVVIGSRLSARAPERFLRPALAGVLVFAGLRLL